MTVITVTTRRARLDAELVRRGLARSREQAAELISAGQVTVSGQTAAKPATQVALEAPIVVRERADRPDYVSRGGHKLAGALAAFADLDVAGAPVPGRRRVNRGIHRRAAPGRQPPP